jgi:hypothetical protein
MLEVDDFAAAAVFGKKMDFLVERAPISLRTYNCFKRL